MTPTVFMEELSQQAINDEKVTLIQKVYSTHLPDEVSRLIAFTSDNSIFIADERRLLSFKEILHAADTMHVDFVRYGIIPLIDCYDNDFIVFNFKTQSWSMFNIVDQISFNDGQELKDLL